MQPGFWIEDSQQGSHKLIEGLLKVRPLPTADGDAVAVCHDALVRLDGRHIAQINKVAAMTTNKAAVSKLTLKLFQGSGAKERPFFAREPHPMRK